MAQGDRGDRLNRLAGMFQGQALVVTGIVFIVWFHRVRTNTDVFAPGGGARRLSLTLVNL
ncbi:DUF4328 domain-containing protein [Streptomyces sp. NPDC090022]|uniref:DUF4328 domain-containing protein n=1 Tax=Streptomyces sp. NPDC090022 TaxID=3365920 RepID=UPI00380D6951